MKVSNCQPYSFLLVYNCEIYDYWTGAGRTLTSPAERISSFPSS